MSSLLAVSRSIRIFFTVHTCRVLNPVRIYWRCRADAKSIGTAVDRVIGGIGKRSDHNLNIVWEGEGGSGGVLGRDGMGHAPHGHGPWVDPRGAAANGAAKM